MDMYERKYIFGESIEAMLFPAEAEFKSEAEFKTTDAVSSRRPNRMNRKVGAKYFPRSGTNYSWKRAPDLPEVNNFVLIQKLGSDDRPKPGIVLNPRTVILFRSRERIDISNGYKWKYIQGTWQEKLEKLERKRLQDALRNGRVHNLNEHDKTQRDYQAVTERFRIANPVFNCEFICRDDGDHVDLEKMAIRKFEQIARRLKHGDRDQAICLEVQQLNAKEGLERTPLAVDSDAVITVLEYMFEEKDIDGVIKPRKDILYRTNNPRIFAEFECATCHNDWKSNTAWTEKSRGLSYRGGIQVEVDPSDVFQKCKVCSTDTPAKTAVLFDPLNRDHIVGGLHIPYLCRKCVRKGDWCRATLSARQCAHIIEIMEETGCAQRVAPWKEISHGLGTSIELYGHKTEVQLRPQQLFMLKKNIRH